MKNAVITGANRGIGLSLTRHYLSRGWNVYAVCRGSSDELSNSGAQVISGIDVADDSALGRLADKLDGVTIDLLINNAGVLRNDVLGSIDYSSIRAQIEVNAIAPLKLTEALFNRLGQGSKVAMITSRMGSIADNTSGGRYGYRMSKAALNAASVSLAHDLATQDVALAIIHPGLVGTDMVGGHGDVTPDQAAIGISQRIDELSTANSGSFWHANGDQLPW